VIERFSNQLSQTEANHHDDHGFEACRYS
jgi:hypothetical protein